ncbi:MAG: hypothetical protein JSW68_09935, partial [Burkholderiales bacterium]
LSLAALRAASVEPATLCLIDPRFAAKREAATTGAPPAPGPECTERRGLSAVLLDGGFLAPRARLPRSPVRDLLSGFPGRLLTVLSGTVERPGGGAPNWLAGDRTLRRRVERKGALLCLDSIGPAIASEAQWAQVVEWLGDRFAASSEGRRPPKNGLR